MQLKYTVCLLAFITLLGWSCVTKVYPDDRLGIDPSFLRLYNSLLRNDTFSFTNSVGSPKVFIVSRIDSIIANKKGWFTNQKPYKLLRMHFREIGKDTTQLKRENEVFINKDPATNTSTLCIQFNNFYYHKDTFLPAVNRDTININHKKITNYYSFENSLLSKNSDDVEILFVSVEKGIIGFKTFSGEVWIRK